ncbi:MAG: respiratory nitrate reductase subunit gamma [Beijerinckiaceae bacterium]
MSLHEFLNYLLFGWYPYVAVTIMIVGSIYRFNKDQYSWRAKSSQLLRRKQLIWGSVLFHVGVLVLFFGHLVGMMTPIIIFDSLQVAHDFKQKSAVVVGGLAGILAFIGCSLLLHRRLGDARIRSTSSFADIAVLALIWVQLVLGLMTIFWTLDHLDGKEMVNFMNWANGLLTLNPRASALITDTALIYKLHIVLGLTLFALTPFTRLVHIWSVPVWFLGRRGYQVVRTRRSLTPAE